MDAELLPVVNNPANQAVLIFVHGFQGGLRDTWKDFPEFLANDPQLRGWDIWMVGYPTRLRVDLVGLWSGDPELAKVALRLRTDMKHSNLQRYKTCGFIGHSMGGLVIQRALLDDETLRRRTTHVFLFGTPSAGLFKASLGRFFKPQIKDMASDGDFIRTLRSTWDEQFSRANNQHLPFRFIAVAGESDEFVPAASAIGPFPEDAYPSCVACVAGDHVSMVKPESADSRSVRIVVDGLSGKGASSGLWNAARVAVELGEFKEAIAQLEPNRDALDPEARVQLALALEAVDRRDDAIAVLQQGDGPTTDVMGTLAGRLKRRWLASRRAEDAEHALALYTDGFNMATCDGNHAQAYYLGINAAFLLLAFRNRLQEARAMATEVLTHCAAAAEQGELKSDRRWRLATEGEANLLLGDQETAVARYTAALDTEPKPRQIASMYQQALYLARVFEDDALAARLRKLFEKGEA